MNQFSIPAGTKDILPDEMCGLRSLVESCRSTFTQAGFEEVTTPTFEYESTFELAGGRAMGTSYRLFDESGRMMVLRPDMTVPIARMASTRYSQEDLPLRFSCIGRVYRAVRPLRGLLRESLQAGVELIGDDGARADAGIIELLCKTLDATGLKQYRIGVGDARLFISLLEDLNVTQEQVIYELVTRDFVGLEREVRALGLKPEVTKMLVRLPRTRGGVEVIESIEPGIGGEMFAAALGSLKRCHAFLAEKGLADRLIYDLGLVRDPGYYTGVVFEAYQPSQCLALGGGGRYDELLGYFGMEAPAIGFDISLERLQVALSGAGQ